jgi:CNT family concentrative nucleoside transporter
MSEPIYLNFISLFGMFGFALIAYCFSEDRRLSVFPLSLVSWGIGFQLMLGFIVFRFPILVSPLAGVNSWLRSLYRAAEAGAQYLFGVNLIPPLGEVSRIVVGFVFWFRALPLVILLSALVTLFYYLRVLPWIIRWLTRIFYPNISLSGAEMLSGIGNIFFGIEAIILVRPYVKQMTRSELCVILSCGFGTATSSSLIVYAQFSDPVLANSLGHLITASILAIPACFSLAKIIIPEQDPKHYFKLKKIHNLENNRPSASWLEPAFVGALAGVQIAAAIVAGLVLCLGGLSLLEQLFEGLAMWRFAENPLLIATGYFFTVVNLRTILGVIFYPLILLTGVALDDAWFAAVTVGRRLIETGIPAYQSLADMAVVGGISDRTVLILAYGLAGFAHVVGFAIFVGGVIALAPQRRGDILSISGKALLAGTLATLMAACVAGVYEV